MIHKNPAHFKPASRVIKWHCQCLDCKTAFSTMQDLHLQAELHARNHHHKIVFTQTSRHVYDGRPQPEEPTK